MLDYLLSPTAQFNVTITEEDIERVYSSMYVGTAKSTKWAVRLFQQWLKQQKNTYHEKYPPKLYHTAQNFDGRKLWWISAKILVEKTSVDCLFSTGL